MLSGSRGRRRGTRSLVVGLVAGTAALALWLAGRVPDFSVRRVWSIGILVGPSPLDLQAPAQTSNPVLTAADVSDVQALFVADPFMIQADGTWYMFFEVLNATSWEGDIGVATSRNGRRWTYQQIVLDEPFHLSYPYVFATDGHYYLIPESGTMSSSSSSHSSAPAAPSNATEETAGMAEEETARPQNQVAG